MEHATYNTLATLLHRFNCASVYDSDNGKACSYNFKLLDDRLVVTAWSGLAKLYDGPATLCPINVVREIAQALESSYRKIHTTNVNTNSPKEDLMYTIPLVQDHIFILGPVTPETMAIRGILDACNPHVRNAFMITQAAIKVGDEYVPVDSANAEMATHLIDLCEKDVIYTVDQIDGLPGYADEVPMEDRDGIQPVYVNCSMANVTMEHAEILRHKSSENPAMGYRENSSLGKLWHFLEVMGFTPTQLLQIFPEKWGYMAAHAHCPEDAAAGRCPGIDVVIYDRLFTNGVTPRMLNWPISRS